MTARLAVIQEARHRLDRCPDIPPEFGGGVAEDVQPGRGKTGGHEVSAEAAIERAAASPGDRLPPARATRRGTSSPGPSPHRRECGRSRRRPDEATPDGRAYRPCRGRRTSRRRRQRLMSPAVKLRTSVRRRPVRMKVSKMARSRRPRTVSGTTASSRRTSSALRPLAGAGEVLGRWRASQGLPVTRLMRIRNR